MVGSTLLVYGVHGLLSAVLANLPTPALGVTPGSRVLPWVTATAVAARLHAERGLVAEPAPGFENGRPVVVAVVPLAQAASPGALGQIRAEVRTAVAFLQMAEAARRDGIELQITSGFRTIAQQTELFNLYRRGRGPLASKPGQSNHQSGHALDLETRSPRVRLWLKRHAYQFGFRRTVPCERWHWEYW